jgi:hypothetical protein
LKTDADVANALDILNIWSSVMALTLRGFFCGFIANSPRVTAFLYKRNWEFAEEYIQQALSPIAENLAYDGEEFTSKQPDPSDQ